MPELTSQHAGSCVQLGCSFSVRAEQSDGSWEGVNFDSFAAMQVCAMACIQCCGAVSLDSVLQNGMPPCCMQMRVPVCGVSSWWPCEHRATDVSTGPLM